jgi:hypothetical protein
MARSLSLRRTLICAVIAFSWLAAPGFARAASHTVSGSMSGAQETPPTTTTASGTCMATINDVTDSVTFSGTFAGLHAPATAALLHGAAKPGTTAPVLLSETTLTASTSGSFSGSGTLSPAQVAQMIAGQSYCEIEDASFANGEIRAQLTAPAVSTPGLPGAALSMLAVALACAGVALNRRQSLALAARARSALPPEQLE